MVDRVCWLVAMVMLCGTAWAANLISQPGFEEDGGWVVQTLYDGQGQGTIDATVARSGSRSMKLVKTSGQGALVLRAAEPVAVKAGVKYTFRLFFHADDAPASSVLLLRVTPPGGALAYNSIDRTAGWTSQSFLINSPAGRWEKRVVTFKPGQDQEVQPQVILYGNPATVWVDDVEFTDEKYTVTPNPGPELAIPATAEQVMQALGQRSDVTAQMRVQDGRTVLLVNDQVTAPVIYKGGAPAKSDLAGFAQANVNLAIVGLKLGDTHNTPGIWRGPGQYDFQAAEDAVLAALRKNPHAILILDMIIYPYLDWGRENPQEVWSNKEGQYAYGWWGNFEGFTDDLAKVSTADRRRWFYPSYQSDRWRQDAGAAVAAVIGHLKGTPLWKAVGGFFISGGHDGQFVTMLNDYDYSPATVAKFRRHLEAQYKDIAALNRVWGTSHKTFDEIEVPVPAGDGKGVEHGTPYLTLGPEIDYRKFLDQQAWGIKDHFAGVCKQAAGKPVITLTYYGSPRLKNFLETRWLDSAGGMGYYPHRNPGYAIGYPKENSFGLHGKLFVQEIDLRSWVGSQYDELYQIWVGAGDTPERWTAIERKLVGMSLANDYGYWYYDMNRYYNDPKILERIGSSHRIAQAYWKKPATAFRPDVAVVLTDDSEMFNRPHYSSVTGADRFQYVQFETSGVPYNVHYLSQVLERPELQDYKVYVFFQNTYINSADRSRLAKALKGGGRTLVWMHDSGYVSESGRSVESMSELVGMTLKTQERYDRRTTLIDAGSGGELVKDVPPFVGMSELMLAIMNLRGGSSFSARYQPFWVEDSSARPLAKFAEDGKVGMAVRRFPTWTSVYVGTPNGLDGQLLHNLAQAAGAYVCGPAGQSVFMNDRFLSLHGMKTGRYTVQLPPGRSRVTDPDSGRELARGVKEYSFEVEAQKTYWFFFE